MTNQQTNEPISKEDLQAYLKYVLTGQVETDLQAKRLRRLSRRVTTLSDVTIVAKVLLQQQGDMITQLMDAIQVQNRVLESLGATPDMFLAAEKDYNEVLAQTQEILQAQAAEAEKAAKEDTKETE